MGQTKKFIDSNSGTLKLKYYCYLAHQISQILSNDDALLDCFKIEKSNDDKKNKTVANLCRHYAMMVQTLLRLNVIKSWNEISLDNLCNLSVDDAIVESYLHKNLRFLRAKYRSAMKKGIPPTSTQAAQYSTFLRHQECGIAFLRVNPFEIPIGNLVPYCMVLQNRETRKLKRTLIMNENEVIYYNINSLESSTLQKVVYELARPNIVLIS